ncbi:MAG: hypothetical protein M1816_000027 [Peltula sp. TS41687]|nr:MAG: hypothetical protein M1816_000027 [Peltula sp. TS41687]
MAIHPRLQLDSAQPRALNSNEIERATASMTTRLETMRISVHSMVPLNTGVRGTSVSLSIPLDEHPHQGAGSGQASTLPTQAHRRREPIRRDSQKRREALLKGKEGSRRRQRWENDHLLSNPWAQPPLPSDWEVRPTYPRHATVPYYLAPLWDEKQRVAAAVKEQQQRNTRGPGNAPAKVPRDLRQTFKRAKGARGLLQELELEIRKFVDEWQKRGSGAGRSQKHENAEMEIDSEDEEIVFVGRNGLMSDRPPPTQKKAVEDPQRGQDHKLILDSPAHDRGGAFARYLVHSLASYYNLKTWSVTVNGDPVRREAYVGIHQRREEWRSGDAEGELRPTETPNGLPRPLWGLV